MSIDEAIAMMHESADYECYNEEQIQASEAFNQIAEWMEELKSYRSSVFSGYMTQKMLKEEYNKAIDDLLEDANEMAIEVDTGTYTMKAIGMGLLEQIAEQLKAGGENEQRI